MFATVEDLKVRWPGCSSCGVPEDSIRVLLADAETWLLALYPDLERATGRAVNVASIVVCSMVRRALNTGDEEGVSSVTDTSGPFSSTRQFANPQANFFVTAQERSLLEAALAGVGETDFMCVEGVGW